jgi:hypothetical protein
MISTVAPVTNTASVRGIYLVEVDIWLFIVPQWPFLEVEKISQRLVVDLDIRDAQEESSLGILKDQRHDTLKG